MEKTVIKASGCRTYSELNLNVTTPYFISNRCLLANLLAQYLHFTSHHCGLSQLVAEYRVLE